MTAKGSVHKHSRLHCLFVVTSVWAASDFALSAGYVALLGARQCNERCSGKWMAEQPEPDAQPGAAAAAAWA